MKHFQLLSLALCGLIVGPVIAAAQDQMAGNHHPPKVLVITREYVKPGKAGSTHEKTESAFVKAMTDAKWPTHYFAADSLSGNARSLFFTGYDSFEDWEKDYQGMQKNPTLAAAMDSAAQADGELLAHYDSNVFLYREEYSRNTTIDVAQMRYFEISRYTVRAGHRKDWDALVKLYTDAYAKALPDAHWATFESLYGENNGGIFIIITPMKSLAEVDQNLAADKQIQAALGENGMKNVSDLEAASIESSQSNLYMFNPKMSYVSEDWVKSDPSFWGQKQ